MKRKQKSAFETNAPAKCIERCFSDR